MGWVPRVVAKHAVRDVRVHQLNLDALDKASDRVTMFTPHVTRSTGLTQPFGRETPRRTGAFFLSLDGTVMAASIDPATGHHPGRTARTVSDWTQAWLAVPTV